MRKHQLSATALADVDEREEARRAVLALYDRVRSQASTRDACKLEATSWSLLTEFVVDGKRFVVACCPELDATARLTPREREVVALAEAGESNKAISYRLGISQSTVGVLLWRAASKLGVRTRAALVRALPTAT